MHLICNVVISTFVLSIIYIDFTIIKSLGCSDQKWCITTLGGSIGALQLILGHLGRGPSKHWGILTLSKIAVNMTYM